MSEYAIPCLIYKVLFCEDGRVKTSTVKNHHGRWWQTSLRWGSGEHYKQGHVEQEIHLHPNSMCCLTHRPDMAEKLLTGT